MDNTCNVCGGIAWYRVIDARGVVTYYCDAHAAEVESAVAKLAELTPPAMPSVRYAHRCERCGVYAPIHVTTGSKGRMTAADLCEKCAELHAKRSAG